MRLISEYINDLDANIFVNDLILASRLLGIFEAKLSGGQLSKIVPPILQIIDVTSSMSIDGIKISISDVYEIGVDHSNKRNKSMIEVSNYLKALHFAVDVLRTESFSHNLIKKMNAIMLEGIVDEAKETVGQYKKKNSYIFNSAGTICFTPPSYNETTKYMDELIRFMNDDYDNINPLIKAAIIHSQFERIQPFEFGNSQLGRLLVSLYLFKTKIMISPCLLLSKAISFDKSIYYNQLINNGSNDCNEWIKFFIQTIINQTQFGIRYIDSLNTLYVNTAEMLLNCVNSPKYDVILECLFVQPVLTSTYLSEKLDVSLGQANRYLDSLENNHIINGDDRKRNRKFKFTELINLIERL